MPPNQLLIGLALFLTFFIMTPVWQTINEKALTPYKEKKISQAQALEEAVKPVRKFMFKQTREKDLGLFIQMAKMSRPKNQEEIPHPSVRIHL
jgi:flagellar biosynthetic protein FliP